MSGICSGVSAYGNVSMCRPQWGCALASCAATKPTRKNRSARPDVLIPVAAQMFHSLAVTVDCVHALSQCWPGAASHTGLECEERWKRAHRFALSSCEEEADEGDLDYGQEDEPPQEDVDEAILSGAWHFQWDGEKVDSEEPSLFCRSVCVRLLPECRACMWRCEFWLCSAVPWVARQQRGIQVVLSPKYVVKINAAGRQQILILGVGPFSSYSPQLTQNRETRFTTRQKRKEWIISTLWRIYGSASFPFPFSAFALCFFGPSVLSDVKQNKT